MPLGMWLRELGLGDAEPRLRALGFDDPLGLLSLFTTEKKEEGEDEDNEENEEEEK